MHSNIKGELEARYSKDGYYALAVLVLVVVLGVWASYEASKLVEVWGGLEVNQCLIP